MDEPILARLEAAEMRARERRLEATSEAERRIEAARALAADIEADGDRAIADAVRALRDRHRREAEREVEAIEAELARLEQGAPSAGARAAGPEARVDDDAGVAAAVELVVSAVLAEEGG